MAQRSIRIDPVEVEGLFSKDHVLLELLRIISRAAMSEEVRAHLQADPHERTPGRLGHRNGYKPRTLKTRVGELELEVPQVRGCEPYHPSLFGKWQRSERAFLVTCAEMYFQGVSTRNVKRVLEAMCDGEISSTTVSCVARELDEKLAAFRSRRLDEHEYPYVKVDARYEKVRVNGKIVSQAVLVTMGYTEQGRREILDWRVDDSESESTWSSVFVDLKTRGLSGVKLLVSDAHEGIRAALHRRLQGVAWQRCRVHFLRGLAKRVSYRQSKQLMHETRSCFAGVSREECRMRAMEMSDRWASQNAKVSQMMRDGFEDCLSVLDFPSEHHRRLASTNELENLMKRLKKRTRVVGVFPSRDSCDRLIGSQLLEVHEGWLTEEVSRFNMDLKA
jgi:putative transposase